MVCGTGKSVRPAESVDRLIRGTAKGKGAKAGYIYIYIYTQRIAFVGACGVAGVCAYPQQLNRRTSDLECDPF